jgi:histidyl-tRNA synthetase
MLTAVKGMNDLLPPESAKWAHVERRARDLFERHGYREIRTPMVERTALFVRSVGEVTDIVEKQMYTFDDRDETSITLRPEATASVVRAYLEHSVHKKEPVTRWYYMGPMFRRERMQRGRYRQFNQIGVEALGVAEPTIDAEQVAMLHGLFTDLGVERVDALVNNLGGPADRPAYRAALVAYFEPYRAELCEDCQRRLDKNPLRILDCKVPRDKEIAAGAPATIDYLGEASRMHFDGFQAALAAFGVPFRVEPRLVRGFDYYTGTLYELQSSAGDLGAQNTLCGGGRYDGLVEELGGPPTPAVGFAMGVERIILTLPGDADSFDPRTDVFLAALGDAARLHCLKLAQALRRAGWRADFDHRGGSMKAQLKRADRVRARAAVIVGDDELAARTVVLKDMSAGAQSVVPEAELAAALHKLLA